LRFAANLEAMPDTFQSGLSEEEWENL